MTNATAPCFKKYPYGNIFLLYKDVQVLLLFLKLDFRLFMVSRIICFS